MKRRSMKGAIRLFEISGISINVHLTFFLLPLIFLVVSGIKGAMFVVIIFTCVTLHELTHSIVAQHFGIPVKDITLLPIGGIASMSRIPDNPRQEFFISIAGPLFNIGLAALLFFIFYYAAWMPRFVLMHPLSGDTWLHTLALVPWVNVTLAVFNLLPAFPLDGGRIFRDILASRMDYQRATHIAVTVGRGFAIVFGMLGLFSGRLLWVLIALFIYGAASAEQNQVDVHNALKGYRVKDAVDPRFISLEESTPVSRVSELMFRSHQEDFPVMKDGKMTGFITRADIVTAMSDKNAAVPVSNVMRRQMPRLEMNESLERARRIMEESGLRALPVTDDSGVRGVISFDDIRRVFAMVMKK